MTVKYSGAILIMCLLCSPLFSQSPDWSVEENGFEYSMTIVSFLNVNGRDLSSTNDKVAAFVDNECRGTTNLVYVPSEDAYFAYLTIFSNTNGEEMTLRIYDSLNDAVIDVERRVPFEIQAHYGDLFQAFSIAQPTLNDEAEILTFDLDDITIYDYVQQGNLITFSIDASENVGAASVNFELSEGAKMFHEGDEVLSGVSQLNFENPITVVVRSADQSETNTIQIETTRRTSTSPGYTRFFRKNAVCGANGAIKVLHQINGTDVALIKNGAIRSRLPVTNEEVLFENLEAGMYEIEIDGTTKSIQIID